VQRFKSTYDEHTSFRLVRGFGVRVIALWCALVVHVSADWPMYRGGPSLRGLASGSLPEKPSLLWTFNSKDEVRGSLAVVGDRVLFGSVDGHLYCVDKNSGKQTWAFKTEAEVESTPLVLGDSVYFGGGDGCFYAVDLEKGSVKWKYKTEDRILGAANYVKGPDGSTRIVFGSYDNFLHCVDAGSGEAIWKYEADDYINGAPAVDGARTVVGGCDAIAHMIDLGDGTKIGGVEVGQPIAGSMAIVDGKVYFGHYGEEVLCIDVTSEAIDWAYKDRDFAYFSTPAVSENRVVIGGRDKRIHCLNREDGAKIWQFKTGGGVDCSPVICDNKVVCGSDDGFLYIVDLKSGNKLWSFEIGEPVQGSPAVADGRIYIGSLDGSVYCFGSAKGKR